MQVKILVVDDDVEVLKSIGNMFTYLMKGYLVLNATSANQGLAMLKEQMPDIIIVDVRLGPSSGMDLISDYGRWIKDKQMSSYQPVVIVITAYEDADVKKRAEEYNVDAFLMKPFTKETIIHAVIDGISKVLHRELSMLDEIRGHQKKVVDKVNDVDKKLNGGTKGKT